MNKTYLISADTLKTFAQGALGAMSFGMYHQYTTNKIMELNNHVQKIQMEREIERIDSDNKREIERIENDYNILLEKLQKLESRWW